MNNASVDHVSIITSRLSRVDRKFPSDVVVESCGGVGGGSFLSSILSDRNDRVRC